MARAQLKATIRDRAGNVLQNALVTVREVGTSNAVADLFAAETGGAAIASLVSNAQGEIEGWLTTGRYVDLFITDNGDAAFYAGSPSAPLSFTSFTEKVAAGPRPDVSGAEVAFTPSGTIAATTVQAAIAELDSETQTSLAAKQALSVIDAKGDLYAGTANDTTTRLAVGANGQVLTADSATATGLKWAAGASGGHTIKEDGTALPARTGLNFGAGLVATDDSANDETDVVLGTHTHAKADLPASVAYEDEANVFTAVQKIAIDSSALEMFRGQHSDGTQRFSISGIGASFGGLPTTLARLAVDTGSTVPAVLVRGAASQSANLTVWQDSAAAVLTAIGSGGWLEMTEQADPAAPAADKSRLFTRDNGAGKTQVCVRFATGAVQVLATEP